MYCEYGAPHAALGVLVVEGRVVDWLVILRVCFQIDLMAVFGFS